MPRSFLVKKYLSKKPNYAQLDSNKREDVLARHSRDRSTPGPLSHAPASGPPRGPHVAGEWRPAALLTSAPKTSGEHDSLAAPSTDGRPRHARLPPAGPLLGGHARLPDSPPALEPRAFRLLPGPRPRSVPSPLLELGPAGGQERFQCLDCRRAYFTFSGLAKHRQLHCEWHCPRCFSCRFCQKEYVSLGALKMHIRTHTLPCVCTLCGKAFSRPWLLQGHIRTHTGEKPFSCPHCSRAFADRSNLRAHLQTHSDIKKYQCKSCSKTFSRISLLSKHEEAGCCPLS
ncbi:zinc finger protein SNAI3 [Conger conger]|uniref:zinc finger protein SNAI3 n=1 Tax=Conger conger TaxID=82655 RepID=UPI002A59FBE1|nr:zinc finger protein SNAI3 [Conger conger]